VVSTLAVDFFFPGVEHTEIYKLVEWFGSNIMRLAIKQGPELCAGEACAEIAHQVLVNFLAIAGSNGPPDTLSAELSGQGRIKSLLGVGTVIMPSKAVGAGREA
jgi:hypothetical protein